MPTLDEVLRHKGAEYAPFDVTRVHRIYKDIAPIFGFNDIYGARCKVIRIIGTNGKGSSGRFITMGLAQNGKSALHFSSPHLFRFNERFFVSSAHFKGDVSDEMLENAHKALWRIESSHEASYFEYATFLALVLAMESEYLVLESGVGGEFDSTSVLNAQASLFTLIGLDHQEMLGNSIEQIALTKLKAMSGHVIVGRQNERAVEKLALEIIESKSLCGELWQDISTHPRLKSEQNVMEGYAQKYNLPAFLRENLYNAMRVLDVFGMKFDFAHLEALSLRGRCERVAANIVLDVGHNVDGAVVLREYLGAKRVNLVYNSYVEKDIEAILSQLLPIIKKVLIISVENFRICPRDRLIRALKALKVAYEDFDIHKIKPDEDYLVFGSFSVAQEFLRQYEDL